MPARIAGSPQSDPCCQDAVKQGGSRATPCSIVPAFTWGHINSTQVASLTFKWLQLLAFRGRAGPPTPLTYWGDLDSPRGHRLARFSGARAICGVAAIDARPVVPGAESADESHRNSARAVAFVMAGIK